MLGQALKTQTQATENCLWEESGDFPAYGNLLDLGEATKLVAWLEDQARTELLIELNMIQFKEYRNIEVSATPELKPSNTNLQMANSRISLSKLILSLSSSFVRYLETSA